MKKVIFIGAGDYAESIADSLCGSYKLAGFIDEHRTGTHIGIPILGKTIEEVPNYSEYAYFISIGDVKARKRWFEKVKSIGLETINVIDPTAIVSELSAMGTGNFVGKYAVMNAGSVIGDNNMINTKALLEHHCKVHNHVRIATNAILNGGVEVEDCVYVGSMACCIGQQKLGENSIIGAGAVVLGDIEANVTAVGVPAKVIKRRTMEEVVE